MAKKPTISTDLFDRYAYWRVISRLAMDAPKKGHVQEIARRTGTSPGMASAILRRLEQLQIVSKEANGNLHVYTLETNYLAAGLKRLVFLSFLHDADFVEKMLNLDPGILSIALYGSRVKGDFGAKSDVDLIIISNSPGRIDTARIGQKIGLDINAQFFTPGQFLKLKSKDRTFYEEVMRNHVVLHGSGLP